MDSIAGGCRLGKLNLALSSAGPGEVAVYDKEKWLACLLLCAIENKGVRKFITRKGGNVLKLWIFTPDLMVSSSALDSAKPVRMLKVMWRVVDASQDEGLDRLTTAALAEDELRLMRSEQELLQQLLQNSSQLLPLDTRNFQEWNVGLLQRFTSTVEGVES